MGRPKKSVSSDPRADKLSNALEYQQARNRGFSVVIRNLTADLDQRSRYVERLEDQLRRRAEVDQHARLVYNREITRLMFYNRLTERSERLWKARYLALLKDNARLLCRTHFYACCVCNQRPSQAVLRPCGHLYCRPCLKRIVRPRYCNLCAERALSVIKLNRSRRTQLVVVPET